MSSGVIRSRSDSYRWTDTKKEISAKKKFQIKIPEQRRLSITLEAKEISSPRTASDPYRYSFKLHSLTRISPEVDSSQALPVSRVTILEIEKLSFLIQDYLAKQVPDFAEKEIPPCIFHVLAQIAHDQYALLFSEKHELLASGLKEENLLSFFLFAIIDLLVPAQQSPLSQQQCRLLLESALNMVQSPCIESLLPEPKLEEAMQQLLSLAQVHFSSPRVQNLSSSESSCSQKSSPHLRAAKESTIDLKKLELSLPCETSEEELFYMESKESSSQNLSESEIKIEKKTTLLTSPLSSPKELMDYPESKISLLFSEAQDILHFYREWTGSSKELAQKGMDLLFSSLQNEEDQESFKNLLSISPSARSNQERDFLFAIERFICKRKDVFRNDPEKKDTLLQIALRMLIKPEIKPLLKKIRIKRIYENILVPVISDSERVQRLKRIVGIHLTLKPFSFGELQFLLLWLQANLVKTEAHLNLVAGTRIWDPEGRLFLLAVNRFLEIARMQKPDLDLLTRWIHFIHCWRQTPPNHDLVFRDSFHSPWETMQGELAKLPKLKGLLGQVFLSELPYPKRLEKREEKGRDFQNFGMQQVNEPSTSLIVLPEPIYQSLHKISRLSLSFPLQEEKISASNAPTWVYDEKIIISMRDTLVFYLLDAHEKLETIDIVSAATNHKTDLVIEAARRFDQITIFIIEELFASSSIEEIQQKTRIFCLVQKELLAHSAFDAAIALHAAFAEVSISNLDGILQKVKDFEKFYRDDHALCSPLKSSKEMMKEKYLSHTNALIPLAQFFGGLTHLKDHAIFSKEGRIDCLFLEEFGSAFKFFQTRKKIIKTFWENDQKIAPHPSLLKAIASQPFQKTDELLKKWDNRSREIHPRPSTIYYGVDIGQRSHANSSKKLRL